MPAAVLSPSCGACYDGGSAPFFWLFFLQWRGLLAPQSRHGDKTLGGRLGNILGVGNGLKLLLLTMRVTTIHKA